MSARTFHRYRSEVLEASVVVEHLLGEALSAFYGQSATKAQDLHVELLTRLAVGQRINTLLRILSERELNETFPFVVPVLKLLFDVRNDMAHCLSNGANEDGTRVTLVSLKGGRSTEISYSVETLGWILYEQMPSVKRELIHLYFALAPKEHWWHDN